jgi:transposase
MARRRRASRTFKKADYGAMLEETVRLGDCLPPEHLARFVVEAVAQLDLGCLYGHYGTRGGEPYAPEVLLGLLFYGYATGVFSTRKMERATYEDIPFRYVAGGWHPDHDTLAHFRKTFLVELQELFVQVLLLAQVMGLLHLGDISLDGTKIHADASKSKAVSYKRLGELETQLQGEVADLFALGEQADQSAVPAALVIVDEIVRREAHLARLAEARAVLEARAAERDAALQAEYDAKVQEREAKAARTGRRPGGRPPTPPTLGPRDADQYNFTDPESRIMKNPTNTGVEQDYNGQVAVDQASLLIVGYALSNHPNDYKEAEPTLAAIPPAVGTPDAAALDTGYFSAATITACETRGITPYIATGRQPHHQGWQAYFAAQPAPPPDDASPKELMAYQLQTEVGRAIYRRRKCTVEPVIGCLKEVLGFRQFSLRGLAAAAGEWCLLCLARNLKRLHVLSLAQRRPLPAPVAPAMVPPAALGFRVRILLRSALMWTAATAERSLHRITRAVQVAACLLATPLRSFSPTSC